MSRNDLIAQLEVLFRQVSRKFKTELNGVFNGELTVSEFLFLNFLNDSGPVKTSDIANQFNVSLSHITAMSDRMIKKNLISRNRSEEDRRVVVLEINKEGKQTKEKMEQKKKKYVQSFLQNLSDEELVQLIHLYKKLTMGE